MKESEVSMANKYNFEERESIKLQGIEQNLNRNYKKYKMRLESELIYDKKMFVTLLGMGIYKSIMIKGPEQWEKDKRKLILELGENRYDGIVKEQLEELAKDKEILLSELGKEKYDQIIKVLLEQLVYRWKDLCRELGRGKYKDTVEEMLWQLEKNKEILRSELDGKECCHAVDEIPELLIKVRKELVSKSGENDYNKIIRMNPQKWEKDKETLIGKAGEEIYNGTIRETLEKIAEDKKTLKKELGKKYKTVQEMLKLLIDARKGLVSEFGLNEEKCDRILRGDMNLWEREKDEFICKLGQKRCNKIIMGNPEEWEKDKEKLILELGTDEYNAVAKKMLERLTKDWKGFLSELEDDRRDRIIKQALKELMKNNETELYETDNAKYYDSIKKMIEKLGKDEKILEKLGCEIYNTTVGAFLDFLAGYKKILFSDLEKRKYDSTVKRMLERLTKDGEALVLELGKKKHDKIVEEVQNILDSGREIEKIREFKNKTITQGIRLKLLQYLKEKENKKDYQLKKSDAFMFLAFMRASKKNCTERFDQFMKDREKLYLDAIEQDQNAEIKKETNISENRRDEGNGEFKEFLALVTACVLKCIEKTSSDKLSENEEQCIREYVEKCRKLFAILLKNKKKLYCNDSLSVRLAMSDRIGDLYPQIEQAEDELLLILIEEWKKRAEKERRFANAKKILLCNIQELESVKNKCMDNLKIRYSNWRDTGILKEYLDFLCKEIFVNELFWDYVYKQEEDIKQEYYDHYLNEKMRREFPALLKQCTDTEGEWFCPNKAEDIFIENYKKYSYFRCFRRAYNEFYDVTSQAQDFLNIEIKRKQTILSLEDKIGNIFREWISGMNRVCFERSILKNVLYTILEKTKIKKKEWVKIIYSREEKCWYKCGNVRKRIWNILKIEPKRYEYNMNQHFTYVYQMNKQDGKTEKSLHFNFLVDNAVEMDQYVDYFESYKLEETNQIYTSWKLYSLVCEFVQADSKNKELISVIEKLAESLKRICSLELRLYVLYELQPVFREIKDDRHIEVVDTIRKMAEIIERNADEVGSLYMKIYCSLLWLFRKEDDWKNLLWLKNMETDSFFGLRKEIKDLMKAVKDGKENKSYCEMKFWSLYEKEPKNPPYSVYSRILKRLQGN